MASNHGKRGRAGGANHVLPLRGGGYAGGGPAVVAGPMEMAASSPSHPRRRHDLDAVRAFAMLLGLVIHGLLSFTGLANWPVQDLRQDGVVLPWLLHAIHGFRMPLFFFLSGYFTMVLWRRRGTRGLLGHRCRRILGPLLLGLVLTWPLMVLLGSLGQQASASVARDWRERGGPGAATLAVAARAGDLETLTRSTADPDREDMAGITPLTWAAMAGEVRAARRLLDRGAAVNARNRDGSTALHGATLFRRTEVVRLLVDAGASTTLRNDLGNRPADALAAPWPFVRALVDVLRVDVERGSWDRARAEVRRALAPAGAVIEPSASDGGPPGHGARALARWKVWALLPLFQHLWFLYYLALLTAGFAAAAVGLRRFRWRPPGSGRPGIRVGAALLALTWLPQAFAEQGFGPDTAAGPVPWPPVLFYYGIFFTVGALGFDPSSRPRSRWRGWAGCLLLAVAVLVVGVTALEARGSRFSGYGLLASGCAALYPWLMIGGLVGLSRVLLSGENRAVRYLADASYWIYLAHIPVLVGLQVALSRLDLPVSVKFPSVCLLSFGLLLAFYARWVRHGWLGRLLHGPRERRRA